MTNAVRLRVELADRPGSLADVAAVIGTYGGNIVAIDVLHREGDTVVDEITVELRDTIDLAGLRQLIATQSSATVLSYQLASPVDTVVRVLRRLAEVAAPGDPDGPLRRAIADLCSTPAVWSMSADDGGAYEAGRAALRQPGTAVVLRTTEQLPALGESIQGEAVLLAIVPLGAGPPRVVLVGRSVVQGFTATESSRIEALVALHAKLAVHSEASVLQP
ncbi:MAG: ACT domain-containing protein [Acidimicrobiales bacterium]